MSDLDRSESDREFEQAREVIPGGVNSPARAFSSVEGNPIFFEKGEGAILTDVDGNDYIDYTGSWGPLIFGHADEDVLSAVEQAARRSTSFGAPTRLETEIAEIVVDAVPSMDRVRFVNSGTEATMSAIRLARGFTGRDAIVKFRGGYHGHGDSLLVEAGSGPLTHGAPSSPGVTEGTAEDTFILPFNDAPAVRDLFARKGDRIAAIILEPVAGNMGVIPPGNGYLQALRDVTSRNGSLLIFDEVMTGFRLSFGGAQDVYNVTPDITTLGKIIGGGMPVGAFGGRKEIMDHLSPAGEVYQAGTLSGNPVSMAAGKATLEKLQKERPYGDLRRRARSLTQGAERAAVDHDIPLFTRREGSMVSLFFQEGPVWDYEQANQSDTDLFADVHEKLLEQGVYFPPSQFESAFINAVHTEDHIEKTVNALEQAFADLS